jgi:hypothetical protein
MYVGNNTLKSASWVILALLLGYYVLVIVIPFYSQRIYLMSMSDIYSSTSETYSQGLLPWNLWTCLGIPMIVALTIVLIRDWGPSHGYGKYAKLLLLLLAMSLLLFHVAFLQVMLAWIVD